MRNRTWSSALFVAVGLVVGSALRGTGSEKLPATGPVAEHAVRQPTAPKAASAPIRTESPVPAAPVLRIDGAVSLAATQAYENAANLKRLADALEPRVAAGDAEAARSLARILDECAPMSLFPNYVEGFRERLSTFPPDRRAAAQRHLDRFEQRCTDLVRAGKISPQRMRQLDRQGAAVDDLVSLARRIANDPAAMPAVERTDALRRIISSRNGEAIHVVADAMSQVDDAGDGILRRYSGGTADLVAWKLVGCDFGAPCGQDSAFVRHECTFLNHCIPGGYREHVQYFSLSPYQFELATDAERVIVQAIIDGRLDVFF
ncbi:MAG: hypothetical protein BGP24_02960 [Lysobacterales bacterium 69-70]|nr:hypothetical protein [Xanthomonadaceae bacterium]ODU31994.1 MAG: hypothetical protein ABS97_17225 [Xanthomonadaceae bacterium SCN 69-320]ODV20049.1 MAG: hypothetical protein ABT27_09150 [Xanthomonadaceae bacterium SCN 69-25]OJZ01717.1 MAG: hypothetical protein BGP24_02960 [Xanthomonadales bacterium 69-70]